MNIKTCCCNKTNQKDQSCCFKVQLLCIILVNFEQFLQRKETGKCNLGDCILTLIFPISLLLSEGFALDLIGGRLGPPQIRFAPPPKKSEYRPVHGRARFILLLDVWNSTVLYSFFKFYVYEGWYRKNLTTISIEPISAIPRIAFV